MKKIDGVSLASVQAVYGGPEGRLWELIMGQQIHIGGFVSSMDLAEKAAIGPGLRGVDLCCCNGAGMRLLVRLRNVAAMIGVDATPQMVELGRQRCREEGLDGRIQFALGDACDTKLPAGSVDFVWGEDAWCYVLDKPRLIAEAARIVKRGGAVAFTDWVEGPGLTDADARRYMTFMKFPSILTLDEYSKLLTRHGLQVAAAQDTGRFAPYMDLYVNMLQQQLTYDCLKIIGFDMEMMKAMAAEMEFIRQLAHAGKIGQGLFVARKT